MKPEYTELEKFIICALYLHGESLSITRFHAARAMRRTLTRNMVWGVIKKELPKKRSQMTRKERQKILTTMFENRIDEGVLSDFVFRAKVVWGSGNETQ